MYPELFRIPFVDIPVKSYGFMMMLGFLTAIWVGMRRAERVKCDPDMILNLGFVALVCGVVGARLFYVAHYWESAFAYQENPVFAAINITGGGLEYFGGLLCAIGGASLYLVFKGWRTKAISWRLYMDIVAPCAMLGLAFGRMGCLLNGCCWGGPCIDEHNEPDLPWAITFPYGSLAYMRQWEDRQITVPAELINDNPENVGPVRLIDAATLALSDEQLMTMEENFKKVRQQISELEQKGATAREIHKKRLEYSQMAMHLSQLNRAMNYPSRANPDEKMTVSELREIASQCRTLPVQPAQVYGIINALLLSLLLTVVFYRRKRHGVVIALMIILYPITRMILEMIRTDNPHDTGGMTISQAVSVGTFAFGIVFLLILSKLPLRSPRAVPFVPPVVENKENKNGASS